MTENQDFLKRLLTLPGLSGFEDPVRKVIAEEWQTLVDELKVSPLGSLHGLKRGYGPEPRPRVLLAAHMDAIGLMVTSIQEGLLRVTAIGGVDPRILPGTPVTVHGRRDLPAWVAAPPDHLLPPSQAGKPVSLEYLLVDTGLSAQEVAELVRVGDLVSFNTQPVELSGGVIAGHSLDKGASVAAVTECLRTLQQMKPGWDVWTVATVQEEITMAGALTSPFDLRPQIAIVVDVTFAKGPGASDYRAFEMDKGPMLGVGPNIHPAIFQSFKTLAEELDLPCAVEPMPAHSGTDAFGIQVVAEGIPCMVLGIPLRYMHTPVEAVMLKDIRRTGWLMAQFIARMEMNFMEKVRMEDAE